MHAYLNTNDGCSVLTLILLFYSVGSPVVRWSERLKRCGKGLGLCAGFGYSAWYFAEFQPATVGQLAVLVLRSILAGLLVTPASWLVLGSVGFLVWHGIVVPYQAAQERAAEAERQRQREADRVAREAGLVRQLEINRQADEAWKAAEAERIRNLPPPPPPKTRQELADELHRILQDALDKIAVRTDIPEAEKLGLRNAVYELYLDRLTELMPTVNG